MVHLDANLLIAAIDAAHVHHPLASHALSTGQPAAADAVAWTEFLSKPIPAARVRALTVMLGGRIVHYTQADAELAAQLFRFPGVRRAQRLDTMIAAKAILAGADLATANAEDFAPFVSLGLKLLPMP